MYTITPDPSFHPRPNCAPNLKARLGAVRARARLRVRRVRPERGRGAAARALPRRATQLSLSLDGRLRDTRRLHGRGVERDEYFFAASNATVTTSRRLFDSATQDATRGMEQDARGWLRDDTRPGQREQDAAATTMLSSRLETVSLRPLSSFASCADASHRVPPVAMRRRAARLRRDLVRAHLLLERRDRRHVRYVRACVPTIQSSSVAARGGLEATPAERLAGERKEEGGGGRT